MSHIDEMIVAVLESGERLISEDIRDRVKARFGVQHFQSYITKRLSFLIQDGVVESEYVVVNGEKKKYCDYALVASKKRNWRQSDAPCPKCGSYYEEKKGGAWGCNKCG